MRQGSSRRKFLATSVGATVGSVLLPRRILGSPSAFLQQVASASPSGTTIQATTRTLDINGKAAKVLGLLQLDGTQGMNAVVGRALSTLPVSDLTVENPPLEEVMSELFARHRGGANGGGANGGGADGGPRDGAGA